MTGTETSKYARYATTVDGARIGSERADLNRKTFLKGTAGALLFTLGGGSLLVGCGTEEENAEGGSQAGVLEVSVASDPATLDWTSTTAATTRNIVWHVFEQLFAIDEDFVFRPMLAESFDVSDDRKTYTIPLRQGVSFHDGSEMKAADAKASIERWLNLSGSGQITADYVSSVDAIDDSTVEITLNEVFEPLIPNLGDPQQSLVILPASIVEAAGDNPLEDEQLVGTGPFRFESWSRGERVVLSKYDDYVPREEDWGGLTGRKQARVDRINFNIVPDNQVRVNGLQTGQWAYALDLSQDSFDQIDQGETTRPDIGPYNSWISIVFNKANGLFSDVELRRIVQRALDKDEIASVSIGNERFWELDGSIFLPDQRDLYTEDGTELYRSAFDPDEARTLLQESDYDGEPVRILTTNDYSYHSNMAQAVQQQLETVGFTVDLQIFEWATLLERRESRDGYDLLTAAFPLATDPTGVIWLSPDWPGFYESETMQSLLDEWSVASDESEKQDILVRMNEVVYDEVPLVKIANQSSLNAYTEDLIDFKSWMDMRFWNVGLAEGSSGGGY